MRLADVRPQHVRFGFSPARECLRGIRILLHPAKYAEQMPWVRAARRRLPATTRRSIEEFGLFFEPSAETFPMLWDESRNQRFEDEMRVLRAAPGAYRDAVLRRLAGKSLIEENDLRAMRRPSWYRKAAGEYAARHPGAAAMLQRFVASPRESARDFCALVADFYAQVFLPAWQTIAACLAGDLAMRKRVLRDYGVAALLRTLSADIAAQRTRDGAAVDLRPGGREIALNAQARVTLTPSFFCWPGYEAYVLMTARGLRCTIAYPIPPLTARVPKLDRDGALSGACAALGDAVRLRMLELLGARDLSTRELAAYLHRSEPVVSRHLGALHRAGLVVRRRSGYFVMYSLRHEALREIAAALAALA